MALRLSSSALGLALAVLAPAAFAQAAPPMAPAEEEPGATEEPPPTPPLVTPKAAAAPAVAPTPAPAPAAAPPVPGYAPWAPAPASPPPQADKPEEPLPPAGPPRWQGSMGIKSTYVANSGFDPFSTNDALLMGSFGLSRSIFSETPLSFAAALSFDFGTKAASARGAPTKLEAYRLLAGPEIRWHMMPELYVFARPSFGVLRTSASLDDGATGVTLYSRAWLLAADADAGAAFAFWDLRSKSSDLRFWIVTDGGYSWTAAQRLALEPDPDSGAPQRTASVDLGDMALRGPYFRVALAASF